MNLKNSQVGTVVTSSSEIAPKRRLRTNVKAGPLSLGGGCKLVVTTDSDGNKSGEISCGGG